MSLLIPGTNSIKDTGYSVANSLRVEHDSSDKFTKTFSTPTTANKMTFSFWLKRSRLGNGSLNHTLVNTDSGNTEEFIRFAEDDQIHIFMQNSSGAQVASVKTSRKYRDVSAWVHIVIGIDTSLSTADDRFKIWTNGVRETSFATNSQIAQGYTLRLNTAVSHEFYARKGGSEYSGYSCETVFIDGQQLDADQFGEYNEDSPTIWQPKDVSGLTFGNNGFYLDYEDSSALGNDVSGNNNDLTSSGFTSSDQSTDTCTNNFMTLSPLLKGSNIDLTEGNVVNTGNTGSDAGNVACTFPIAFSGKWYFEVKITAISASGYPKIAVFQDFESVPQGNYNGGAGGSNMHPSGSSGNAISTTVQYNSTTLENPDGNITITAPANGNIIQFALDMDNGAIYVGVNGTYYNSGDPTSGSSKTGKIGDLTVTNQMMPMSSNYNGSATAYNFGGTPGFSISSGNADANGFGNFEYAPPAGYFALCSKNIGEFG